MIKISLHEEIAKDIRQYMDGFVTHKDKREIGKIRSQNC
jgi:hypothetical protein